MIRSLALTTALTLGCPSSPSPVAPVAPVAPVVPIVPIAPAPIAPSAPPPRAASTAVVDLSAGRVKVLGALSEVDVRVAVATRAPMVRACYERELAKAPSLAGELVMQWEVDGGGRARNAKASSSTMSHLPLEGCVAAEIETWTFPPPKGAATGKVIVRYPMTFKPRA